MSNYRTRIEFAPPYCDAKGVPIVFGDTVRWANPTEASKDDLFVVTGPHGLELLWLRSGNVSTSAPPGRLIVVQKAEPRT